MNAEQRRYRILEALKKASSPISASLLASEFSVSRQIIVGDIALLRAAGSDISATPRGYIISEENSSTDVIHKVACIHSSEDMEKELNIIVDNGCTVLDVKVEHPVYGEITGELNLQSRYDIQQFIDRVKTENALPLSILTSGIHLHTLRCPSEEAFVRVAEKLKESGLLFTDNND